MYVEKIYIDAMCVGQQNKEPINIIYQIQSFMLDRIY